MPHRVALHVDRLLARALQGVGRYDEARGVIDGLGYVTNLKLIGPFYNERVGGFEVGIQASYDHRQSYVGQQNASTEFQVGLFGQLQFSAGVLPVAAGR